MRLEQDVARPLPFLASEARGCPRILFSDLRSKVNERQISAVAAECGSETVDPETAGCGSASNLGDCTAAGDYITYVPADYYCFH